MYSRRGIRKTLALSATLAVVFLAFFGAVRPWFLRWGATTDEVKGALPGDGFLPGTPEQITRAITINAPSDRVWPWLAQLGQDRGGFYSYEVLEDLVGCEMENADWILPEHQRWVPGDHLWMYPPDKLDSAGGAPLVLHEPGRTLVFATRSIGMPPEASADGTWGFFLKPVNERSTRLLVRGRAAGGWGLLGRVFYRSVFEPVHFVMERKMMTEIKARAEGRSSSSAADNAQVIIWTLTFGLFVTSMIATLRRRRWHRPLVCLAAAAVAFQLLTLIQPPPLIGALVVLVLALGLWWNPASCRVLPRTLVRHRAGEGAVHRPQTSRT